MSNTTDTDFPYEPYENDLEELGAREAWEDSRDYADQDDPAHDYTDEDFDDSAADAECERGWDRKLLERMFYLAKREGDFEDRVYLDWNNGNHTHPEPHPAQSAGCSLLLRCRSRDAKAIVPCQAMSVKAKSARIANKDFHANS
jgi:hypothetical protein